jgi:hypothetical protein
MSAAPAVNDLFDDNVAPLVGHPGRADVLVAEIPRNVFYYVPRLKSGGSSSTAVPF